MDWLYGLAESSELEGEEDVEWEQGCAKSSWNYREVKQMCSFEFHLAKKESYRFFLIFFLQLPVSCT